MRPIFVLTLICSAAVAVAVADEGMWLPGQLPELGKTLKTAGLELKADSLADLTAHPMGAVIWLGGCTASFVSEQGLVVTNHHCAYGSIQHNSTDDNNILEKGFLAGSIDEELPTAPGSRVLVTTRVEDVTDRVLEAIPENASGKARYDAIEAAEKALVAECEEQDGVRCRVSSFYGGVLYQRFTQLEIRDVRLVYAPARSVGKYGGDVDNWMWPRHTGDYSFLRAYVGPDGKPTEPSPQNVPYRPKHWLRVTKAREVFGSLLTSVERVVEQYPDAELKVAPLVAGLNNMTKNYTGMLAGFDRVDVVSAKRELEAGLVAWIAADKTRAKRYGSALDDLRELVAENQLTRERDLYWGIVRRSTLLRTASRLHRLAQESLKPDMERKPGYQERDLRRIRRSLERMESTYDRRVDRLVWGDAIRMYTSLPPDKRVEVFDERFGIGADGVDSDKLDTILDAMYAETELEDLDTRLKWMDASVEAFEASDDPFIRLAVALYPVDLEMEAEAEALTGRFKEARPRFMEALIAHQQSLGLPVYPDANSTLRVTTGHIAGYRPRDGVRYEPFTTLEGLLEKETGVEPFDSPEELLRAVRDGDRGPYALERLGSVPLDFLSTVDTTGGNSGSPTLNGRGELVGLLFDGAWESLLSDWYYEPERVRSIHTDVRYMLWIMDRVDNAHHLLREMGIEPSFGSPD
jgi:hypothetical protein